MPSKILNNAVELNKINFDSTNNKINFTVDITNNGNAIADATAGSYANSAFLQANAAFQSANNVAPQVQPAFDKANAAFNAANSVNVYDANTTSTGFFSLPKGNTAQRPANPIFGASRYNTDINGLEVYNSTGWQPLAAPPTIATVSPTVYSGESGTLFIINGTNFTPDAQVYFITANNTQLLAASVTYYSAVQLRATTPRAITIQEEPISVKVTQQSGTTTLSNCIDAGGVPNWVTTAGTLGSIFGANTVNVYVTATDPEGTAVSYQLSSGSLPGGLQLSANGLIQGLASSVLANTTYNFVIKANDTVNNNTDRSFSYTILNRAPIINTASGLLGTFFSGNSVPSTTISAYDPDGGQITFSAPTGNIVNTTIGSANGTIVGTPIVVTTNTTYTIGITATDEGSCTASNTYTFTVLNRPPVWNTAATLPSANADSINSITVNAYDPDGGSVTYSLSSGSLPTGITINSANGAFVGVSDDVPTNTIYSFTLSSTDVGNDSNNRTFNLTLTPLSDNNFSNNVLLLKTTNSNTIIRDASSNNVNLTVFGDSRASPFSPYNTSWSNYFDGSGDSLNLGDTSALAMGTGDFTIECWFYTSTTTTYASIFSDEAGGTNPSTLLLNNGSNNGQLTWYGAGLTNLASTSTGLNNSRWHHVAFVREGNVHSLYVNGVREATTTTTAVTYDGTTFLIGNSPYGSRDWNGYISNFRVTKRALYSGSSFSVSTTPLVPVADTVLLTCNSNRFYDASNSNLSITRGGDVKVVGLSPFAETDTTSGSIYLDGSGDYLTTPSNSGFTPGTGDFTYECWIYTTSLSSYERIFYWSDNLLNLDINTDGSLSIYVGTSVTVASAGSIKPNQWQHVVLQRSSGTMSAYVNGTRTYNSADSTNSSSARSLSIGAQPAQPFIGYIADVRIVNGSAVYSGATITVPTTSLSNIANTKLLTLQNRQPHNNHGFQDKSNNKTLITRNGNVSQGTFTPFSADPGKWSIYQPDVSSDYITFTSGIGSNLQFTGDYTVEAFVFPVRIDSQTTLYLSSDGSNYHALNIDGSNYQIYIQSAGSTAIAHGLRIGAWNHVAMVRSGSTVTLYTNGVSKGTISSGGTHGYANPSLARTGGGAGASPRYISNLRVLKGTALYTGAFTPPTNPLTNITNTVLLVGQSNRFIDNSTANSGSSFTIGVTGSPFIQAFSAFTPNTSYTTANIGGSAYMDGSGDHLQMLYDSMLNGNVTVEGWYYFPTSSAQLGLWGGNADLYGINLQYQESSNQKLNLFIGTGGSWGTGYATTTTLAPRQWHHIAYTKTSGNLHYLYINGVVDPSINGISASFTWSGNNFYVGIPQLSARSLNGYVSNFRISNTLRYTSTFTPPTSPFVVDANTRLLLSFTDAALIDYSGKVNLETIGDARANSSNAKFGTTSFSAGTTVATGSYLATSDIYYPEFGTGDFTIESWIRLDTTSFDHSAQAPIIAYGNGGGNGPLGTYLTWYFSVLNGGTGLRLYRYDNTEYVYDFSGTINANRWYHVAMCRSGTSLRAFVDGTQIGTTTTNSLDFARTSGTNRYLVGISSGGGGNPQYYRFPGLIQDVRVTRSARYTANFTPPVRSFPTR